MFGVKEYEEYVRLFEVAENIYKYEGETDQYREAVAQANAAYENYEYAAGIKVEDF